MPPAVIAAGVVAGGTIIGGAMSSHSQNKAANQAANAEAQATQAQLQLGQQSLAQSRDIYNQNKALLDPFVQRGNVAGASINALLGLPAPTAATPGTTPATPAHPSVPATGPYPGNKMGHVGMKMLPSPDGPDLPNHLPGTPTPGTPQTGTPGAGTPGATTPPVTPLTATQAMNNFANSAGMQFQLQQGENAINNGYAAHEQLQSGAALKALQSYGQNTALNNYFMPYMSLLGGQQSTGAQAASATAGVGSNFSNTAAGINGQMAGYIGNGADAAANAAIARGYAGAQFGSTIGNALGQFGSSFFKPGA
jgi:hypothetical protein